MSSTIITIGLHASASTWVFNIVRELLIAAHGADQLVAAYADETDKIPPADGRHRLIKSHHGSPGMDAWLATAPVRMILSIRDPRDAAISMAQRFDAPLAHTAHWLLTDTERMRRLATGTAPVLRYEDRFFDRPETVATLAAHLGLDVPADIQAAIFARYTAAAVRAFTRTIADLPPERIAMVGDSPMEITTQLHRRHLGDTTSLKWHSLPADQQRELTRLYRRFLIRFGYQR